MIETYLIIIVMFNQYNEDYLAYYKRKLGTAEALSPIVLAPISRDRDGNRRKPEDRVLRVTTGVERDRVGLVQSRERHDRIPWKWSGELLISKQRARDTTMQWYEAV
ncbi:hypothetical protein KPH14_004540 [Odynerus spinipes]|uniref:Uncharacterized protein n=1 Tax=Odynerus spinipes TaxID=1348599 RepID=A0AAD9VPR3_9HYME|nr:hypothetical protein KPH14_004540 [Odynerus spinipes]